MSSVIGDESRCIEWVVRDGNRCIERGDSAVTFPLLVRNSLAFSDVNIITLV